MDNFAAMYNARREADLGAWSGSEEQYDQREKTMIEAWNNTPDEIKDYIS